MSGYDGTYHYLPVDEGAMTWGLYLTGAGHGVIHPGQHYPPDRHPGLYDFEWWRGRVLPEFQLILITNGRGLFESRPTGEVSVGPGSLICLFPDIWHRYRPDPETGWAEHWISFSGEIAHRLMEMQVIRPESAVQPVRSQRKLVQAFDELLGRIEGGAALNSILLSLHAMGLIGKAVELASTSRGEPVQPPASASGDDVARQALELIWTQSHRPLSVEQIAETVGMHRRTVERRFLAAQGHTLRDEINACRLSRAKRLLEETRLPVKVVSYLAGFPSAERMRVAFVNGFGQPPSEYRTTKS